MLTNVYASGFKGGDFAQELSPNMLIVGPNGTGKSTRTQALCLALMGYVPGSAKTNADILDTFGTGDELRVGVAVNGHKMERRFRRAASGTVSQFYYLGSTKVTKDGFAEALQDYCAPAILDLAEFFGLSDAKKVGWITSLFPPAGDVESIEAEIKHANVVANESNRNLKGADSTIARLQKSIDDMDLPDFSLKDVRLQIETLIEAQKTDEAALRKIEDREQEERIRRQLEEAQRAEQEREAALAAQHSSAPQEPQQANLDLRPTEHVNFAPADSQEITTGTPVSLPESDSIEAAMPLSDVEAILLGVQETMQAAGCEACAAKLVIKAGLRKIRKLMPRKEAA